MPKSKELTAAFDLIVIVSDAEDFCLARLATDFFRIFYYVYKLIPDFVGINAMECVHLCGNVFLFTGEYTDAQNRGAVFYFRIRRDATCKYSAGGVEGFHESRCSQSWTGLIR